MSHTQQTLRWPRTCRHKAGANTRVAGRECPQSAKRNGEHEQKGARAGRPVHKLRRGEQRERERERERESWPIVATPATHSAHAGGRNGLASERDDAHDQRHQRGDQNEREKHKRKHGWHWLEARAPGRREEAKAKAVRHCESAP